MFLLVQYACCPGSVRVSSYPFFSHHVYVALGRFRRLRCTCQLRKSLVVVYGGAYGRWEADSVRGAL